MRIVSECDCVALVDFRWVVGGGVPSKEVKQHVFNAHAIQSFNLACKHK